MGPPGMTEGLFVEWGEFWRRDRSAAEWALEDVLARGRGHAIYAPAKSGKSLFALWCATQLVGQGVLVVYLDYEMSDADLYERLEDMGHGPETDLSLLRYALLPCLPPLDTAAGGAELLGIVDRELEAQPGRHVAVMVDTIGRATAGEENPADTIRGFYRHTGLGLRQRGATWARFDHAGKDIARGARGSSAKNDDVDLVWRLAATEGGLELHRDYARVGWAPERVAFRKLEEPVLRFERVPDSWPAGTLEAAAALDRLGVPLDASGRTAQRALREAGDPRRREAVLAALRHRRMAAEAPGNHPGNRWEPPPADPPGTTPGTTPQDRPGHRPEPPREPVGTTLPGQQGAPTLTPRRGVGAPGPSPNGAGHVEGWRAELPEGVDPDAPLAPALVPASRAGVTAAGGFTAGAAPGQGNLPGQDDARGGQAP